MTLHAPFPWFGGKRRVGRLVWEAFGDVPNYVEPFAGSLAVLLTRPTSPRVETVNDSNAYLTNVWRAIQADADAVAKWAMGPVHEADLHARHTWLMQQEDFRERMLTDPHFFDVKIAGWWLHGVCAWLGSGWCVNTPRRQLPDLSGDSGARGRGIHASGKTREEVHAWLLALGQRMARVAVTCGDWTRVVTKAVTWGLGHTAVFLDPPYREGIGGLYSEQDRTVSAAVRDWAVANGDNPMLRIALCGLDGEHIMPPEWRCVPWKAVGGFASQAGKSELATRERIWFSPGCSTERQPTLFDCLEIAS